MKLAHIASALCARLDNGSPDTEITGVAAIENAGPNQLTFVANPKYATAARTTKAAAVIVAEDFPAIPSAMLRSKNPYLGFARAIELFHRPPKYAPGVHPTAVVHASVRIAADGLEIRRGNADAVVAKVGSGVDPVLGVQLESGEATQEKQEEGGKS